MNFLEEYEKGKAGKNYGLDTGIPRLNRAIDGTQKKSIFTLAAGPKVGKTKFADFCFVLSPYLIDVIEKKKNVHWKYFSYEIDRVRKEFNYAAFFLARDFDIHTIEWNGHLYSMGSRYLMGKLRDKHTNEQIPVSKEHEEKMMKVYETRIIPLFGKYDANGNKTTEGYIDFVEARDNPTGLRKYLHNFAEQRGKFVKQPYHIIDAKTKQKVQRSRVIGYRPDDPEEHVIIITDHMRKLIRERGFTAKENIDKWVEYQVEFRNWCHWTFVDIIHINRSLGTIDRIKYQPEYLHPTGDDVKDTGNLSEESDYVLTMFNPADEKYGIKKHFGYNLDNHPNYRSLHLVESRDTECPQHMALDMFAATNIFKSI